VNCDGLTAEAPREAMTIATLGVGYIVLVLDPERRALHDRIAGTHVVER
jgi:uncharacterized RDD family membrane protein YckC